MHSNNPPSRPLAPKPQIPEPMEIGQSVQTRNLNYQNRPRQINQFQGKRPLHHPMQTPYKQQRNFHIGIDEGAFQHLNLQGSENYNVDYGTYYQPQNEETSTENHSLAHMQEQYPHYAHPTWMLNESNAVPSPRNSQEENIFDHMQTYSQQPYIQKEDLSDIHFLG